MPTTGMPTREDRDVMAATDVTLQFQLFNDAGPINITNDIVKVYVVDDDGTSILLPKSNGVGQHSDPLNGKTAVTFTKAELTTHVFSRVRWWYEVRRIAGGTGPERVHIVGELRILPSPASM